VNHPHHRHRFPGAAGEILTKGHLESGDGQFVHPQGTLERVGIQLVDGRLPADDQPGLRPPEQFVPAEGDQVHTGRQCPSHGGLVRNTKVAEVEQ